MNKNVWIWLSICVTVCVLAVGCSLSQPLKKPDPTPKAAPEGVASEPTLRVYMHESGEMKSMKMEEYIAGVVAGEMEPKAPMQALAAQAILARTFTIEAMQHKGGVPHRGADASTDVKEFQAYNANAVDDHVRQAVEMTRGMIVTYRNEPIHAWFHSSAGGITALAKEGLNFKDPEPPYITSVQSPDDIAPANVQNWTASFSKQEVTNVLAKMNSKVDAIQSVSIAQKGPSGRTTMLKFNDVTVSGPDFRVMLGGTKLKSMLLDSVVLQGDTIVFTGKGFGHGVGMSQWGASKLAMEGKKPEEIIAHYFKDVEIQQKYQ